MRIRVAEVGIYLIREAGDKALSAESNVTFHIRRLLNERDGGGWHRCWPDRIGLTGCRQGVRSRNTYELYWHANYQVEAAHIAFNHGKVLYHKAR